MNLSPQRKCKSNKENKKRRLSETIELPANNINTGFGSFGFSGLSFYIPFSTFFDCFILILFLFILLKIIKNNYLWKIWFRRTGFEFKNDKTIEGIINILNGEIEPTKENIVKHKEGIIYVEKEGKDKPLIMIRGWGNLTGIGGYNLNGEYAGKIQDTLAEYIVERLSK